MKKLDETKIEYLEENFMENMQEMNDDSSRDKHVDNLKRFIMGSCVFICAIPVFFCLYLMVKMNKLDARVQTLKDNLGSKGQVEQLQQYPQNKDELSKQDAQLLDASAATEIEKTPGESTNVLMGSSEDDADAEDTSMSESSDSVDTSQSVEQKVPTTESQSVSVNSKHKVYLTFDDGPSTYTDEILDVLKKNDVKATFFVVYTPDKELWPMYKRIVDEGHTLAMHSYSHVYGEIYADKESFIEDVNAIHDFLYELTGVDCKYYRFPGGSSNSVTGVDIQDCIGYLYESGITYYDWNSLSEDAVDMSLSSEELNENVMSTVRTNPDNSIVLLHDLKNNPETAEGLQALIDTLKDEGYKICPIDDNTIPVQHITYEGE